jgi:6,7-dimethyl-8-ribityllumazine synthase
LTLPDQTTEIGGQLSAAGQSFGIVVSRFNSLITTALLTGAKDCLIRHGANEADITVVHCPGAFEIPQIALRLAESRKYDGIICLGCIIRGETPHFDHIAAAVTRGVGQVALESGIPTSFGILTTDNLDQALERAGSKAGNKGWDAALSAIELIQVAKQLSAKKGRKG